MFFLETLPDRKTMELFARRYAEMEIDTVAACLRLLRVASRLFRDLEAHFTALGLSQARFLVLLVLERHPERQLMPVEIARQLGISKKNTARVLAFMEEGRLIARRAHNADARATIVSITAKGSTQLEKALPGYYRVLNRTLKPLDAKAKKTLIALLDQVGGGEPVRAK